MLSKICGLKFLGVLLVCTLLSGCSSAMFPNLLQLLLNLSQSFPPIWHMITGISYLMGIAFIMRAIYQLKIYGEGRTMMSGQASLKGPVIYFFVGGMLLWFPSSRALIMTTIFGYGTEEPLSYVTSNPLWNEQSVEVLMQIVQIVGLISFIRGWVFLAHAAQPSSGQPVFGKAMTHIVGGILAINIEGTREMLMNTFGVGP